MLMLLFGVLWLIGAGFLLLVLYAMVTAYVATAVGLVLLIAGIWWLSGRGGKPPSFWPNPPAAKGPERKWGPNHIGHPAGQQSSLDHPDMW